MVKATHDFDGAFFARMEEKLNTAVICDVLDDFGYRCQNMSSNIRPLNMDYAIAGLAKTVLAADVYTMPEIPYEMEIAALNDIRQNEIVVAATNRSNSNALWGELLSTAAMLNGARGAVIDGCTRDIKKITAMGFKVFAAGINPLDSKGRSLVIDYDCDVVCGGVRVSPGDIVFGDCDGIAVIPIDIARAVIDKALEKVAKEKVFLTDLNNGLSLREAFAKHGIL